MMDTRAPSPYPVAPGRAQAAAAYGPPPTAYGGYAGGYAEPSPTDTAGATSRGLGDAEIVEAKRSHARGSAIYVLAWIVIAISVPLLAIAIGVEISSSGNTDLGERLLLASLGLLGAGIALRGVGFSLMMKADFLIRTHAWLGSR
jgi:hypothetical protein